MMTQEELEAFVFADLHDAYKDKARQEAYDKLHGREMVWIDDPDAVWEQLEPEDEEEER